MYVKEIDGDGNCLFRSICDQMYGHDKFHKELRQYTMDYIVTTSYLKPLCNQPFIRK